MPPPVLAGGDWITLAPYLVPAAIILMVLRRNLRPRPLKVERLWFYPSLMALAAGMLMVSQPPPLEALPIGLVSVSLVVGVLVGWQRGRLTHIVVNPETHDLTSKTSPIGLLLILALFAVRYVLRLAPVGNDLPVSASVLSDASLMFAIGLMGAQRVEMWIRARRLVAEAAAAKAAPPG